MEKIFTVIKQMETDGVIGRYAIGGAVGSIFWLEPIMTELMRQVTSRKLA